MLTPTAAELAQSFGGKTHGKSGSIAPLFQTPKMKALDAVFFSWFALQEPVSTQQQVESALPLNAGTPMHSNAQVGRFMALCLGYSTASCADFMMVLVESEALHSKPIKNQHRTAICGSSKSAFLGPSLQRQGSKTRGFWQNT